MGSFNETCGVSGLPIAWETPCRLFILRPHWYLPLHYQSVWEPLGVVPLKGTYDDYGKLKDPDLGPAFMLQQKTLLKAVQEFSEETQERHHEIVKRYPDDPLALYELCERGVLEMDTPHGVYATAPFYVREDVYQLVIDRTSKAKNWHGQFLRQAEDIVECRLKHHELTAEYWGLLQEGGEEEESKRSELMEQMVDLESRDYGHGRHEAKMLLLKERDVVKDNPELKESLRQAMIEFELFSTGLELVHAGWRPNLVRGQESDYEFHAEWHRDLSKLADEAHRHREEDL